MTLLIQIAWSFLPGLTWLWFIRRYDKYEPEPRRQILKVYLLGMLVTIPAGIINGIGNVFFPFIRGSVLDTAICAFLVIGPTEELFKWMAAYLPMRRHPDFNEPVDGIVYASTAALGFASLENVGYVLEHGNSVVLGRWISAVPMHFLVASLYGHAMGLVQARRARVTLIWQRLLLAAVLHGAYDFFLVSSSRAKNLFGIALAIALFIWLAIRFRRSVRELQAISPFAPGARPDA